MKKKGTGKFLTPCRVPGCPEEAKKKGYCFFCYPLYIKQQKERERDKRAERDEPRLYDKNRWTKVSLHYRRNNPLCERCEDAGRTKPVKLVHHIVPVNSGGDPYKESNLQALCYKCHAVIHRELDEERS